MPRTLVAALLALLPAQALAQAAGAASPASPIGKAGAIVESEGEADSKKQWSVDLGVSDSQSMAIDEMTDRNSAGLSVSGAWEFNDKMTLAAGTAYSVDTTTSPNNGIRSDLGVLAATFSYGNFYKEKITGISLTARASLAMPIGYSQTSSPSYPSPSVGLSLGRSLYGVSFSYSLAYGRDFPVHPYDLVKHVDYGDGATAIPYPYGTIDNGYKERDALTQGFGVSYQPIEKVSLGMNISYSLVRYYGPSTASVATSGSDRQNINLTDNVFFGLSASYQLSDHYSLGAGLRNSTSSRPTGQDLFSAGTGNSTIPSGIGRFLFNKIGTSASVSFSAHY